MLAADVKLMAMLLEQEMEQPSVGLSINYSTTDAVAVADWKIGYRVSTNVRPM
jgi:hypothetical protein